MSVLLSGSSLLLGHKHAILLLEERVRMKIQVDWAVNHLNFCKERVREEREKGRGEDVGRVKQT